MLSHLLVTLLYIYLTHKQRPRKRQQRAEAILLATQVSRKEHTWCMVYDSSKDNQPEIKALLPHECHSTLSGISDLSSFQFLVWTGRLCLASYVTIFIKYQLLLRGSEAKDSDRHKREKAGNENMSVSKTSPLTAMFFVEAHQLEA